MISDQNEQAVKGLVLVGGKSSRMQQAKAHLAIHGIPQWRYCENVLHEVCDEVYFSVSPQLNPSIGARAEHIIDDVFKEPIGPLGGIISAFRRYPQQTFFVLACDLPNFGAEAAQFLFTRRRNDKRATVFVHEGLLEPLCALYEPSIKQELARAWAEDRTCPRRILDALDIERVEVPNPMWLTNLNHAHELEVMRPKAAQSVRVKYYASLKERAGCADETVTTAQTSVAGLYAELKTRHGFILDAALLRFAVNDQIVAKEMSISAHDTVTFIPPVSGG